MANSIWHSIRMDCVSVNQNSRFTCVDSNLNALPDIVEELLNNYELISNLWLALQLDPNDRGNLSQMWLVHRIMKNGFLWAGQYALASSLSSTTPNTDNLETPGSYHQPSKPRKRILQSQTEQQLMAFEIRSTCTN